MFSLRYFPPVSSPLQAYLLASTFCSSFFFFVLDFDGVDNTTSTTSISTASSYQLCIELLHDINNKLVLAEKFYKLFHLQLQRQCTRWCENCSGCIQPLRM